MNSNTILLEYAKGDLDKRASMFLYYRELRVAFARIDEQVELDTEGPSWKKKKIT